MTPTAETTPETATSTPSTSSPENENAPTASPTTRVRRENVNDKAERYLREGRLRVVRVDGNLIVAKCRGGGIIYDLGFDPKLQQYRCTCPARGPCAHLVALQRVTAVER
jgi:uncharacterized Zn finger protein